MGVVYRARQVALNRTVALKMILAGEHASPRDLVRFLAEAEAVAAIAHPNVVQVYEVGNHAGRSYMALEYCDGGTLTKWMKDRGKFPAREAAQIIEQISRGVAAAHDQGIVHRDLKPGNILLAPQPKVVDFGLAKMASGHDLTRTEAIMGTPAYMSPEQAMGKTKFVGPQADVYALGSIKGHTGSLFSAAFSADGSRVVTASFDNTAKIWDAKTGVVQLTFVGHTDPVFAAAFSVDGAHVVTACRDNTAKLWDATSGAELHTFKGHTESVSSASFSEDGSRVVTAGPARIKSPCFSGIISNNLN